MKQIRALVKLLPLLAFLVGGMTSCHKTDVSHSYIHHDSVSNSDWSVDTAKKTITVFAPGGTTDASPELQACIAYQAAHPGYIITPTAQDFYLYEPLVAVNINSAGVVSQAYIYIVGASDAKDANNGYTTNFHPMFGNGFCIGVQQGKGCWIQNIHFIGIFGQTNQFRIASLNAVQVDTTAYSAWDDGVCSNNPVSPYTAIAIDPFSDPANYDGVKFKMYPGMSQYYVPGMSKSGSTDVNIVNCRAEGFVVGFIVTPSFQQNGDNINFTNCRVDNCRDGIAFTQSQSKACTVNDLMSWGQTYSVFDGLNYGAGRGDGTTFADINVTNIAGNTHQIFCVEAKSFSFNATNVYAESLYKLGEVIGVAGANFIGFQIDFQVASPGVPSPDFYYYGFMTTWTGCTLRVYNNGVGGVYNRVPLNMAGNIFIGGMMSSPPVCANQEEIDRSVQPGNYPATFQNVAMYYTIPYELNANGYDSLTNLGEPGANGNYIHIGYPVPVTIDPTTFTGSLICPAARGNGVKIGDPLLCFKFYNEVLLTGYDSYEYPLGFVTSVSTGATQDTVYFRNSGYGIYTGSLNVWDDQIKTSVYHQ